MKILSVLFLIAILILPIGMGCFSRYDDQQELLELVESGGEEEEGFHKETENAKGIQIFQDVFSNNEVVDEHLQSGLETYQKHNSHISDLVIEVSTPPPNQC